MGKLYYQQGYPMFLFFLYITHNCFKTDHFATSNWFFILGDTCPSTWRRCWGLRWCQRRGGWRRSPRRCPSPPPPGPGSPRRGSSHWEGRSLRLSWTLRICCVLSLPFKVDIRDQIMFCKPSYAVCQFSLSPISFSSVLVLFCISLLVATCSSVWTTINVLYISCLVYTPLLFSFYPC